MKTGRWREERSTGDKCHFHAIWIPIKYRSIDFELPHLIAQHEVWLARGNRFVVMWPVECAQIDWPYLFFFLHSRMSISAAAVATTQVAMATRYAPIFRPQESASIARFRHIHGTKIMMYENNTALAMITNHKTKSGIFILFRSDFIQYDAIQMLAVDMPILPPLRRAGG